MEISSQYSRRVLRSHLPLELVQEELQLGGCHHGVGEGAFGWQRRVRQSESQFPLTLSLQMCLMEQSSCGRQKFEAKQGLVCWKGVRQEVLKSVS